MDKDVEPEGLESSDPATDSTAARIASGFVDYGEPRPPATDFVVDA